MRRIFLALGICFMSLMWIPSASAADDCDTAVIDNTAGHVLDVAAINASTTRLDNLGADVRVRAFEQAPNGSFDSYRDHQVQQCASWRGPDGQLKGNMALYLFSMDHKSAIFYGSNWHSAMDSNVDRIRADYMNAQFKLGNFTKGITSSEAESYQVMNNQLHPAQGVPQPAVRSHQGPMIGHTTAKVLEGLAAVVVLALLAVGFVMLLKRGRRLREELASAKKAALSAANTSAQALSAITDTSMLKRSIDILSPKLSDDDRKKLAQLWSSANAKVNEAFASNGELTDAGAEYSLDQAHDTEAYDEIASRHTVVATKANAAQESLDALQQRCEQLQQELETAPKHLEDLTAELAANRQSVAAMKRDGYITTLADDQLSLQEAAVETARQLIERNERGQAIDQLEVAASCSQAVREFVQKVPLQRKRLSDRLSELRTHLAQTGAMVTSAEAVLAAMKSDYDRSCWQDLDRTAPGSQLAEAKRKLDEAETAISMRSQDWDGGSKLLDQAEVAIKSCTAPCSELAERQKQLAGLQAQCPERANNLLERATEVLGKIRRRDGSQSAYERDINQVIDKLEGLVRDLGKRRPAYRAIDAKLDAIKAEVADIGRDSKREHDDANRHSSRSSSSSSGFGTGLGTGYVAGSLGGSSYGGGGGGGIDFGGGSSGSWGGDGGGGSSGGW